MKRAINNSNNRHGQIFLDSQPCVKAIREANLRPKLKRELNSFISRNIIPSCGRVSPDCLKAHLVKTAKSLDLPSDRIAYLKTLFKSRIGYKGYYLDCKRLRKI